MDLSMFRAVVENGTGFVGGPAVDNHPHLTLMECMHGLAEQCLMNNMELCEAAEQRHDREVSAVYSYLTEGVSIPYADLNEANKEGLLAKIKSFFEKIRKFVQSIIKKIKMMIDRKFLSGKQFWARYGTDKSLTNVANKNIKFNGYKMEKQDPFTNSGKDTGFDRKSFIPGPEPGSVISMTAEQVKAEIEKIDSDNASARAASLAQLLTGESNLSEDSWESDLREKAFGDKEDMEYGEGMFTLEAVKTALNSEEGFKKILDAYTKMEKAINEDEKYMRNTVVHGTGDKKTYTSGGNTYKSVDQHYKDEHSKADEKNSDGVVTKKAEIENEDAVTTYCTKYLSLYNEAVSTVQKVRAIRVSYQDTRIAQAKRMLSVMISGKEKKKEEAFDLNDTDLVFDF